MIELFLEKIIKIYFEIASKKQKSRKIVEFCRVFGNFQLLFQFVKDNKIYDDKIEIFGFLPIFIDDFYYCFMYLLKLFNKEIMKIKNEDLRNFYKKELKILVRDVNKLNFKDFKKHLIQKGSVKNRDEYRVIRIIHKMKSILARIDLNGSFGLVYEAATAVLKFSRGIKYKIDVRQPKIKLSPVEILLDSLSYEEAGRRANNKQGVFFTTKDKITILTDEKRSIPIKNYAVTFLIIRILNLKIFLDKKRKTLVKASYSFFESACNFDMKSLEHLIKKMSLRNIPKILYSIFIENKLIDVVNENQELEKDFLMALIQALERTNITSFEDLINLLLMLDMPFIEQKRVDNSYNSYPYYIYKEKPTFKEAYLLNVDVSMRYIYNHLLYRPNIGPLISFDAFKGFKKFNPLLNYDYNDFEYFVTCLKYTFISWLLENNIKVYTVDQPIITKRRTSLHAKDNI